MIMKKTIIFFLTVCLFLTCFSACSQEETVDDEAADRIKDAIIAAENGEQSGAGLQMDTDFFILKKKSTATS